VMNPLQAARWWRRHAGGDVAPHGERIGNGMKGSPSDPPHDRHTGSRAVQGFYHQAHDTRQDGSVARKSRPG